MKRIGISKNMARGIFAVLVIALATTLVSATLLTSFGTVETTIDVTQSVTIDGHDWDVPITHAIGGASGGCCYCFEHTIENNGCEPICLDFETMGVPDLEGITVTYTEKIPSETLYLEKLELEVLDGMAEWDDFEVYVDGILVYTYDAQGGNPEDWIMHTIWLSQFEIPCCGTHTIKIDCTSPIPWTHFNPYGQLAVNYGALYCEGEILCDEVDIGNPSSEAGHNLQGWGPIEPANTGGGYGGIPDCRTTWFWITDDFLSLPDTTVTLQATNPGTNSYFDIALSDVPGGYSVMNGDYMGWCVDQGTSMCYDPISVMLYSSYDPGIPYPDDDWDLVNYLINNKHPHATTSDIQSAIWYFIDGETFPSDAEAISMVENATVHGEGFEPAYGEMVAVYVENDCQQIFIEVPADIPRDPSWATFELTCEDCQQECECDCDIGEPLECFCLEPGESILICLCYELDVLIAPGQYVVTSQLVPCGVPL